MSEYYRKGHRAEMELVYKLWKRGFFSMRSPASGRKASKIFYPDVIAIKNCKVLIFEVKLRKHKDTIHIHEYKVRMLRLLEERTGGKAYIAVKVSEEKKWYFFPLELLEPQIHGDSKRYVITVKMYDNAYSLSDILWK